MQRECCCAVSSSFFYCCCHTASAPITAGTHTGGGTVIQKRLAHRYSRNSCHMFVCIVVCASSRHFLPMKKRVCALRTPEERLPPGATKEDSEFGRMIFDKKSSLGDRTVARQAEEPPRATRTHPESILTVPNSILMSKNQVEPGVSRW